MVIKQGLEKLYHILDSRSVVFFLYRVRLPKTDNTKVNYLQGFQRLHRGYHDMINVVVYDLMIDT